MVPKLRLFDNKTLNSSLKAIIRKKTLLLIQPTGEDRWNYIIAGDVEGWCQLNVKDPTVAQAVRPIDSYRRYHEWKGLNVFFYHGKIMFGSDFNFFLGTNALYVLPSIVYFIFVVPEMYEPILTFIVMILIFLYAFVNLWFAALTEPGIIPRNPPYITVKPLDDYVSHLKLACSSFKCS